VSLFEEMMADISSAGPVPNHIVTAAGVHPRGWEPGVSWNGKDGVLSTGPVIEKPTNWDKLLEVWDLDPKLYEVIEPVQFRAWDAAIGGGNVKRMYYFKAAIVSRRHGGHDVDNMMAEIRRYKPSKPKNKITEEDSAFVVGFGDWQIGKCEADGGGTVGFLERFTNSLDGTVDRIKELRRIGRKIPQLYIAGLGDCPEGVGGHYAMQEFSVDLSLTEQIRVVRRIIVTAIRELAPMFDQVVVAPVPGNHGEVRKDGKAHTKFSDNWDLECFVQAAEIFAENPEAYGHVSFTFPHEGDLVQTLNIAGTITTLAHGHQFPGKNSGGANRWWADQAHGQQEAGQSTLLLAGHLHHTKVEELGSKTFIQVPSLDGGSEWWKHRTGQHAKSGMASLVVGGGKWSDLQIL